MKRSEEAAWKWAADNKLDPYSMGRAYGEGYEQAEKDTIERVIEWLDKKYVIIGRNWAELKKAMEEE